MSLTVEFFRVETSRCTHDDAGLPITPRISDFPYGTTCDLVCSVERGPSSPLRGGSANNIYVIPAPNKLKSHTATLLAAASCVPAIFLLISNWNKICEINRKAKEASKRGLHAEVQALTGFDNTNNQWNRTGWGPGETALVMVITLI